MKCHGSVFVPLPIFHMRFPLNKVSLFGTKEWQLLCQHLGVSLAPFSRAWSIGPIASENHHHSPEKSCGPLASREISEKTKVIIILSIKIVATYLQRDFPQFLGNHPYFDGRDIIQKFQSTAFCRPEEVTCTAFWARK